MTGWIRRRAYAVHNGLADELIGAMLSGAISEYLARGRKSGIKPWL